MIIMHLIAWIARIFISRDSAIDGMLTIIINRDSINIVTGGGVALFQVRPLYLSALFTDSSVMEGSY